jgi:hypothetical protein
LILAGVTTLEYGEVIHIHVAIVIYICCGELRGITSDWNCGYMRAAQAKLELTDIRIIDLPIAVEIERQRAVTGVVTDKDTGKPVRGWVEYRPLASNPALKDKPLLADLSQVMRDASICGLGQAAPNPVDCVVKYFPNEIA